MKHGLDRVLSWIEKANDDFAWKVIDSMKCKICGTRRPRRYCPGVQGDICSVCCGTEREVSVSCPFDCEYLVEARLHEKLPEVDPNQFPNLDIRVSEGFLRDHEPLLMFLAGALLRASLETPGAVDADVRDALESLVRTYRTLQSGLIYETRSENAVAAKIQQRVQASIQEFRQALTQQTGMATLRDSEVLGILAFLQRLAIQHDNKRPKGRAFLHFLSRYFAPKGQEAGRTEEQPASGLITP